MVVEINSENSQEIGKGKWVLDFWAEWCAPCRIMSPLFHQLSEEIDGLKFGSVDIENFQELAQEFQIMSIPTFLILEDGKEKGRLIGVNSKENFKKWIEKN